MLLVGIGCAADPESRVPEVPPTSAPSTVPTTSTAPPPPPTATTTAPPSPTPPATPEEASRLLEQQGIDPRELSREVGDHMRRRFQPKPAQ